ncbi:MAG: carbon monoxide dehydrogenase [Gammaproteobacteria bacterium]|nr:carbon monoxide dehydrogenase [Gammaproteobacteria bacterium]NIR85062.1 carbon monoxide dehydrogenase [Gammaproteobacteria bacterium]NIR88329.1 carbon monoxide dehydrogenase [Gammaproteobacteria bacterium]NIU06109.1 carbon monoxide dehydrogenase [Gammaproteobacteria bacterium]NIV73528.1 carbon monoxide dehydrogenase [Gammaproteobacteria bacterium]
MKPAAFDYIQAQSIEEVLDALAELGDAARVLAGGQSLIAMLNMRLTEPEALVDITRLADLDTIQARNGWLEVGAATTQAKLEAWPELAERVPLLAQALPYVGHWQTRNRGTVCGSIVHADPSSELPLCLATLGGEVRLRSRRGRRRTLGAEQFQTGILTTARAADELVEAVRFPLRREGAGYAFREITIRRGDFALVALAAEVRRASIRLGVGGVADRPEVREWPILEDELLADALNDFAWEMGGYSDTHATAAYRRELVRRIGLRVIREATACRA